MCTAKALIIELQSDHSFTLMIFFRIDNEKSILSSQYYTSFENTASQRTQRKCTI